MENSDVSTDERPLPNEEEQQQQHQEEEEDDESEREEVYDEYVEVKKAHRRRGHRTEYRDCGCGGASLQLMLAADSRRVEGFPLTRLDR